MPTAADFELQIISASRPQPPGRRFLASSKRAAAAPSTMVRPRPGNRFSNSRGEK